MVFIGKAAQDGKGGIDFGSEYNAARFRQWLKDNPGKEFRIEPHVRSRSIQQNRFYWLYLERIEQETGNNSNDLHEWFKRTLLPPTYIIINVPDRTPNKIEIKIPNSTTKLSKVDFIDYIDKISALTNVQIPDSENYNNWKNSAPDVDEEYDENITYEK